MIIGLGYCGWDHLCVLPSIPLDDKVKIIERIEQGGGPSATAIYAAAKLGAPCAFMGVVGNDTQGRQIMASLKSVGVDTSAMKIRDDVSSPIAYCWIEQTSGKRSIAWTSGACQPLSVDEVNFDLIKSAKLLHLDGHQTEAAIEAARFARKNGVLVSIDAGTIVPDIEKLLEQCHIIIASEKFIKNYCHETNPQAACKKLFKVGTTIYTGVTVGSRGSYGFDGQHDYFQSSIPVNVVDTTGAGDTYHGAFIYTVVQKYPWQECMRIAATTAAIKCTKLGGRSGLPTLDELKKHL